MLVNSLLKRLLFSTVYISVEKSSGESTVGTGFVYVAKVDDGIPIPVVITNRHVVDGAVRGTIRMIEGDGQSAKLGRPVNFNYEDFGSGWVYHPNDRVDVAAKTMVSELFDDQSGREVYFLAVTNDLFPTVEQVEKLDILEAVTFVGYPAGLYDSTNLTPVMRQGLTATPIDLDWQGMPAFLVDGAIVGGSSGSPVFIANQGAYHEMGNLIVGKGRVLFLGIVAATYLEPRSGRIVPSGEEAALEFRFSQTTNLGIVYKWNSIREVVEALIDRSQDQIAPIVELWRNRTVAQLADPTVK